MYLLVDSGSTKADWVLFDSKSEVFLTSSGLNPSIQERDWIQNQIESIANAVKNEVEKIFYYGAGTKSQTAKTQLVSIFRHYFPTAELIIESDLLAAGRALCNGHDGIICILGTGSNAAICNGHEITEQLPSLGYLLGDEGSGNQLGKEMLRKYFYQKLSVDLKTEFENAFPELSNDFLYKLYHVSNPSAILAKYGQFVVEHKTEVICRQIILDCFMDFINSKLIQFKNKNEFPVHFCGSIAFYLREELNSCLTKTGFQMGTCIQKPIQKLLDYHRLVHLDKLR